MLHDAPTFSAWQPDTLAKYAREQYLDNIQLREALEQLRADNKDLSKILREQLTKEKTHGNK